MVTIISLGGSIVAPDVVDAQFVKAFVSVIRQHLARDAGRKVILIVGGGAPARNYQSAYREICEQVNDVDQDWIGVMATRLNAELVRAAFVELCSDPVVTDPSAAINFGGRVLVAAGWKPGFSTDFDAVWLAERFDAKTVINLSNIEKVFTDDPKKNAQAMPLDTISWAEFRLMVGDVWEPGKNCPFDPIASRKASDLNLQVIVAGGRNLANLEAMLEGKNFIGTTIGV